MLSRRDLADFHRSVLRQTVATAAVFLVAGCVPFEKPARSFDETEGLLRRGKALVRSECAGCHAIALNDQSPMAPALPLRDLHRLYDPENVAEAFAEGIVTGHPAMPQFQFEEPDIQALIAYLNSIQISSDPDHR